MKLFYNLIFVIFGTIYFPFFLLRLRQEKEKKRLLRERLGLYSNEFLAALADRDVFWIHAVSVGEVFAARPMIEKLAADLPHWKIILSTVTPTGQSVARKLFPGSAVFYFPFDTSGCVRRALNALRPRLILLMETEIWPNLILGASERNIPVGIINGRLSPRSYKRYRWIRSLFKGVLEKIRFFLVQFQWDADRLQELGVSPHAVQITGNMKFDVTLDVPEDEASLLKASFFGTPGNVRIFLAGSTHEGEEEILMDVFRKLRFEFPDLKLILAPRHVTRAKKLQEIIEGNHFRCRLVSQGPDGGSEDVWILDTMGDLKKWYGIADFVFVGGSMVKHGGQNPIEPALWKKPIFFGPHIFNFQLVYETLMMERAVYQVYNATELYEFLRSMLLNPLAAKKVGLKAFEMIQKFQGATQRNTDFILQFLEVENTSKIGEEVSATR